LPFDNSSNIIIENMSESEMKILVKGQGSKNIRLVNSKFNYDKITYENCPQKVTILVSE